jgi:double-strand break repair protein MRE11
LPYAKPRPRLISRHVGILSVQGSQFQIAEIPLKTVRPFEMDEVVLTDVAQIERNKVNLEDKDTITAFLRTEVSSPMQMIAGSADTQVEHLIQAARTKWEALHQDDEVEQKMMLPLIRLKVSCDTLEKEG